MEDRLKRFPLLYRLFMKIEEPRTVRLLHFVIYLCMVVAGLGVFMRPPSSFQSILGYVLVCVMGTFIGLGGLLGTCSVLPGIWWLERSGIILLITGMACYTVTIIALGSSPLGLSIAIAFICTFVIRWLEIRRYQLAPREE